ncbi:MAG: hypothetical protein JOZ72_00185 [Alphaproteobacteria bacterium]|nr:hypothetical protein [Alphaproteobacteria bacterium]
MSIYDKVVNNLTGAKMSIVREIQRDLIDDSISVSATLRKARLAARKLDLREFLGWIAKEADGYQNEDELPKYRIIHITPKFHNPYNGWCPILTDDPAFYRILATGYLKQSVEELEDLGRQTGRLAYTYSNELTALVRSQMEFNFDICGFADRTQLKGVANAVRNILLDWAVDLEQAGVLGEGLGFSADDKTEAAMVTQNIYAQNIGTLGNVTDQASVQNTFSGNNFSLSNVSEYMKQIEGALPNLPDDLQGPVASQVEKLKQLTPTKKESAIRSCLSSIKKICEGAATSVAAQGIAAYLKHLL